MVQERRLACTAYSSDAGKRPERNAEREITEIIGFGAFNDQTLAVARTAFFRHRNAFTSAQIIAGDRIFSLQHAFHQAAINNLSAELARARSEVDDVVRCTNGVFVVLNHHHAIADVAQMFERFDQAHVIALV